jgi:hypothetical protein
MPDERQSAAGADFNNHPPKHVWVPALVICGLGMLALLGGLVYELFLGPLDETACLLLNACISFAAGGATYFVGGAIQLQLPLGLPDPARRCALSACGGVAVFLFIWTHPCFDKNIGPAQASGDAPKQSLIQVDELCGARAPFVNIPDTATCSIVGTTQETSTKSAICVTLRPATGSDDELCTQATGNTWGIGPFALRPAGSIQPATLVLGIATRDWRQRAVETPILARTVKIPSPDVHVTAFANGATFGAAGSARHVLPTEHLVLEVISLTANSGAWFLPVTINGNEWTAEDRPDARIPAAPEYHMAVWLGTTAITVPMRSRPQGFIRLTTPITISTRR